MQIHDIARRAKAASVRLGTLSTEIKNQALMAVADALVHDAAKLLEANHQDVVRTSQLVVRGELARPLLDRLKLSENKVMDMAAGVRSVAQLPDPVGRTLSALELDTGLELTQKLSLLSVSPVR